MATEASWYQSFRRPTYQKDADELHLTFSSQIVTPGNMLQYQWHRMTFHEDFNSCLRAMGGLPYFSVESHMELKNQLEHKNKEIEALKAQIREMGGVPKMTKPKVEEHAKGVFQEYDLGKKGKLGRAEFRKFARAMLEQAAPKTKFAEAVFEEMFAKLDTRKDGSVSIEDLTQFYASQARAQGLLHE